MYANKDISSKAQLIPGWNAGLWVKILIVFK